MYDLLFDMFNTDSFDELHSETYEDAFVNIKEACIRLQ